jgi:hypothetical protein
MLEEASRSALFHVGDVPEADLRWTLLTAFITILSAVASLERSTGLFATYRDLNGNLNVNTLFKFMSRDSNLAQGNSCLLSFWGHGSRKIT